MRALRLYSLLATAIAALLLSPTAKGADNEGLPLTLNDCRTMALRNNRQVAAAKVRQDMAAYTHQAAKTKRLPHVDVLGGYEFTSRPLSLLSTEQQTLLGNIVTAATGSAEAGQAVANAFDTDTRNVFAASIMVSQPIYMGGAITALNRMAALQERMAAEQLHATTQDIIYNVDNTYWTVVSLTHKRQLAESYLSLVKKLQSDVKAMIREGVATRADGLRVDVKVSEAEMQLLQVANGLELSQLLLCQLCGIEGDSVALADNELALANGSIAATGKAIGNATGNVIGTDCTADYAATYANDYATAYAAEHRPELKLLQSAVDLSRQAARLVRAEYLPQVALTAGYLVSNPSLYNGFERRFEGVWNVGVMLRLPVWHWQEGTYKLRAAKAATSIAELELAEATEGIGLQVRQCEVKVREAERRLALAAAHTAQANEHLRCATLGFREGVMDLADVMAAQTAWLQAEGQKIDAEIDIQLSNTSLRKALGETIY